MKMNKLGASAIVAALIGIVGCKDLRPGQTGTQAGAASSGPKVKVEFYVMSKCPFGTQVEDGIKPVLDDIGDRVDFQLDFIVTETGPGAFNSLHGEPEVKGDIVQLCAIKNQPEARKYMAFIGCQNKNMRAIPEGWESCAGEAGLDVAKVKACADGPEGKSLLSASAKRAQARQANGSPTIFIANEPYQGGRAKNDFTRAICEKMAAPKAEACAKIPEPVLVNATVLTDKRCVACGASTQGIESTLRGRFFPKLAVATVDYASAEGKKLYKELQVKYLPVWLVGESATKSDQWSMIARWMTKRGAYWQLQIPATFDPTAEICDNKIDDTADGKIDCDDKTCENELACRPEKKQQVDVFVMSQCPYGVQALNATKEVLANFKGAVKFDVHYIAEEAPNSPTGFSSLHGDPEVNEDLRGLCAKKYYGRNNKYLDYVWCRNQDIRSDKWEGCAKDGIAAATIKRCAEGKEGKELLATDLKIAKALGIGASPTWLANNRFKFSGIAPDAIKASICQHNPGLANCDKQLTQQAAAPSGSCN